eukprot:GHVU01018270.1.p1 GENE.GHVU01018270.1~~GHVU01018270.1.p1  ORF type:complete len:674 (+),score=85.67 GHVU01018270.1:1628-3649(+)
MPLGDGKAKQESQEIKQDLSFILDAVSSIGDKLVSSFQDAVDEAGNLNTATDVVSKTLQRGFAADLKRTVKNAENLVNLQVKASQGLLKNSEIEKAKLKIQQNQAQLEAKKLVFQNAGLKVDEEALKAQEEQNKKQLDALDKIKKQNKESVKQKSLLDLTRGSLTKYADKLDESGTLSEILNGNIGDVLTVTRLTEVGFAMLVKAMMSGSKNISAIQKDLGVGKAEARELAGGMAMAAANSEDLRVTTAGILKANQSINASFQTAAVLNNDILVGATSILDAQIMSAEATSQLAGDSARLGMTFDESLKTQEDAVNAINSQTGAQISLKGVLEASNKVTGQIRAQLGSNPEAIARAVAQAKALGFELEQIASAGKALLDFESSISAELEAELLTGKQLNLEKARLAALTGDYETLTKEIADNVGDFNEFSQMNVLQQEAIAKSVGMTADDLANSLVTEENRAQLLEDAVASGNEQSVQQLKAMSASETFAKTLEKIQGILGDIGLIFAPILDGFASLVGFIASSRLGVAALATVMGGLAIKGLISAVGSIFTAFAPLGPFGIPLAIAGIATMYSLVGKAKNMKDGVIGPDGGMVVSGPKGSIQLDKQDSIIAGTNLGGGGGGGGEGIDYDKMASAMSKAQVNVSTKYDSFSANSSTANGGRYQSAARYESKFA